MAGVQESSLGSGMAAGEVVIEAAGERLRRAAEAS